MEKIVLSENELAERWGVSPKTLQRWWNEGRGLRSSSIALMGQANSRR